MNNRFLKRRWSQRGHGGEWIGLVAVLLLFFGSIPLLTALLYFLLSYIKGEWSRSYRIAIATTTVGILAICLVLSPFRKKIKWSILLLTRAPIHWAIQTNRPSCASLFITFGANTTMDTMCVDKKTRPLHLAVYRKRPAITKRLLDSGVDPNQTDGDGLIPIEWAAKASSTEMAAILLSHGADKTKGNPFFYAAGSSPSFVNWLFSEGFTLPKNDGSGDYWKRSPLYSALSKNRDDIAVHLLKKGVSHEFVAFRGYRPIHIASYKGLVKTTRALLKLGANPNVVDEKGDSPLKMALTEDVKKILLEFGAK